MLTRIKTNLNSSIKNSYNSKEKMNPNGEVEILTFDNVGKRKLDSKNDYGENGQFFFNRNNVKNNSVEFGKKSKGSRENDSVPVLHTPLTYGRTYGRK